LYNYINDISILLPSSATDSKTTTYYA